MSSITDLLAAILAAKKGEEVRGSIHDAIELCYQDGKAGVNDLEARQLIEAVAEVNEQQAAALEVLQARVEELESGEGGSSQQSTTIDIPTVLVDGGVVENVSVNNNSTTTRHITFTTEFTETPKVMVAIGKNVGAVSQYGYLSANILYPTVTTTGFDFFLANRTGSDRSPGVVWYAYQPTVKTIDLDITIPETEGMTEAQVRAITGPIAAAVDALKTGYDGTSYQTAAEAVRTQINDLHVLIGDEPGTAISASAIGYGEESVEDALDGLNGRLTQYKAAIGGNNIDFLPLYNAVISGSNVWSTNTNGYTKCVAVPVDGGESLTITHREGITFHLAFLKSWTDPVSGAAPDFCNGYESRIVIAANCQTTTRTIPTDCRYVYILMLNNNVDYSPLHFIVDGFDLVGTLVDRLRQSIEAENDKFTSEIEGINNRFDGSKKIESFDLIDGYVNKNSGGISIYTADGKYKRTDYIQILNVSKIESNFVSNADAGYAFYDENKTYISGGASYPANVPYNAEYVILSNYSSGATHTGLYANIIYRSVIPITIACYGDSVTEGMRMPDIGTATYGGSCYPSQLQTMLTDMGLNAKVYNYGHSGERSTEVCARIGGRICGYLGEDVTIPANNAGTSLGIAVTTNYKVTGSKLYSTGKNADGTTAQILFTKLGHDTRPLMIGDRLCNIYQAQQGGGMLQTINLVNPTGEETTLPALSVLTTGSSKRNTDICVVYMGINDGSNLTLAEWIDRCRSAIERNPKTLILGATNHNWTYWQGMTGATADAKRAEYLNACLSAFGSYYLDLYDILTTDKCIKIAQAGGYLADRTEAQITADDTALNNRQTPPSLTLEGTAGEVHLNAIGYYVLAKSVCDKLNQLGLL